jgi:hypothetical protein
VKGKRQCKRLKSVVMDMFFSWSGLFERMLRRGMFDSAFCCVEQVTASSFANNNQLAVMPGDRVAKLEWSRRYLSVLGVENNRLYQLRLQVPENVADLEQGDLRRIMESFQVLKLEA